MGTILFDMYLVHKFQFKTDHKMHTKQKNISVGKKRGGRLLTPTSKDLFEEKFNPKCRR